MTATALRPDEDTRIGTTVVYDAPGQRLPVADRPRYTFLGIIEDDAEPGAYCWVAERPDSTPFLQRPPEVTPEYTADLLIIEEES